MRGKKILAVVLIANIYSLQNYVYYRNSIKMVQYRICNMKLTLIILEKVAIKWVLNS